MAATRKAPAKRPARKPAKRPHVVKVRRDAIDGKWYVERRSANGVRLSRSKGYAKLSRAEEVGEEMAAPARLEVIPT